LQSKLSKIPAWIAQLLNASEAPIISQLVPSSEEDANRFSLDVVSQRLPSQGELRVVVYRSNQSRLGEHSGLLLDITGLLRFCERGER
jgi:hypothetical protein